MHPATRKFLFAAMVLIFLASACAPAPRTQSPADIEQQVQTAVAMTVVAQNAQTQAAQSAVPAATNTMLPTQTEAVLPSPTAIIATVTPVILPTKASSGGGGGGGAVLSTEYSCDSIRRRPLDNTIFKPGKTFDIKWTIVNTGKKTLKAGLDLKYNSGTKLTSTSIVELPELKPGAQYQVDFDATAPHKEGTYIMTFVVEGGLCYPYTAIVVQK